MSRLGYGEGLGADDSGREYGSRRQKVFGYLKAANDLRQAYTSSIQEKWQNAYDGNGVDAPGAFPDADIARSGDEEMVIFPSYARRHVKRTRNAPAETQPLPGTHEDIDRPSSPGDMNYWKQEWEKYEDDNAIVDIDVRGWLYVPQRGAMNRKHRLLVALARKLSGIPAPAAPSSNPIQQNLARREDEDVSREAQSIINRGEHDADIAWRSNRSGDSSDSDASGRLSRVSTSSLQNKDNLSVANAHLMERLRPFMNNPTVGGAVTLFFFNDEQSQSRTTLTDDSGHFNIRTALEFVPTHVRILASESLSVTEEIRVIEPRGISLISDIDDTIKHSAIASGAKEIFRNTFVRELDELTIDGVREWYNKLADMGVNMHYVSNSPWQIYPLLKTYFKLAGLPPGSFHLKQYSGMLQGIFEPTAERKRVSLEKIMRDFPERKFILVGDSGEADLEVYTEIVQQNPGRILGVFIRDVTTTEKKDFFDQSFVDQSRANNTRNSPSVMNDDSDSFANRPALPPRQPSAANSSQTEDLISFDESSSDNGVPETTVKKPPAKPSKPSALRTATTVSASSASEEKPESTIRRKPAPPLPDKPRRLSTPQREPQNDNTYQDRPSPLPQRKPTVNDTYTSTVKNMAVNAYNNIPSTRDTMDALSNLSLKDVVSTSSQDGASTTSLSKRGTPPPPPPPRRTMTNTPSNDKKNTNTPPKLPSRQGTPLSLSSNNSSNHRLNTTTNTTTNPDHRYDSGLAYNNQTEDAPPQPLLNKREELWKRRWERAQQILSDHGVLLGSWRVGSDAQDITAWLVEDSLRKMKEKQGYAADEKMQ